MMVIAKYPESLVVAARSTPRLLRTLILALATVAPEGSFTKPEMVPKSDWANIRPEATKIRQKSATATLQAFLMWAPLRLGFFSYGNQQRRPLRWPRKPSEHYPLSYRCSVNIPQTFRQCLEAFVGALCHGRRVECHT